MWSVLARGTRCTLQPHSVGRLRTRTTNQPSQQTPTQPPTHRTPTPALCATLSSSQASWPTPPCLVEGQHPCLTHSRCARFLEQASQSSTHTSGYRSVALLESCEYSRRVALGPRSPISGLWEAGQTTSRGVPRLLLRNSTSSHCVRDCSVPSGPQTSESKRRTRTTNQPNVTTI
jgi:hypothetical protein